MYLVIIILIYFICYFWRSTQTSICWTGLKNQYHTATMGTWAADLLHEPDTRCLTCFTTEHVFAEQKENCHYLRAVCSERKHLSFLCLFFTAYMERRVGMIFSNRKAEIMPTWILGGTCRPCNFVTQLFLSLLAVSPLAESKCQSQAWHFSDFLTSPKVEEKQLSIFPLPPTADIVLKKLLQRQQFHLILLFSFSSFSWLPWLSKSYWERKYKINNRTVSPTAGSCSVK